MIDQSTAIDAIEYVTEEAFAASDRVHDEATLSYHHAVALVHVLRAKLHEIRAVCRETVSQ